MPPTGGVWGGVDPDGPEAQRWLREELAKAPYQAAQPTWFDRLSQGFLDWLGSLLRPTGAAPDVLAPVIVTLIVIAALVAAWLIYGRPRLNRRHRLPADLFGESDERSADQMRRAGAQAAAAAAWNLASTEIFRALARGLVERTVLTLTPGTTAHAFAARAGEAFPDARTRLATAATVFDQVRYLGRAGTEPDYLALVALEEEVRRSQPVALESPLAKRS